MLVVSLRALAASVLSLFPLAIHASAQVPCAVQWLPTFGQTPGLEGATSLCAFDDGSGSALYVGGPFQSAGGVVAHSIARWSGSRWSNVGAGFDLAPASGPYYTVYALAVFDDGSGPSLYAGGSFHSSGGVPLGGLARWRNGSWQPVGGGLGSGASAPEVWSLAVFDDGQGPALYAGGAFDHAGGVPAAGIARWNGSTWSALGSGLTWNGALSGAGALEVFDDGSGPALYAGGFFSSAGGVPAQNIACWDGGAWSAVGAGVAGTSARVACLRAFDDGSGPTLFAGGSFAVAGGVTARGFARWDGSAWSAAGNLYDGPVLAIASFDSGAGPELHACGGFLSVTTNGAQLMCIARRSGSNWHALGSGLRGSVRALLAHDDGSGEVLYAAGASQAGTLPIHGLARWNGSAWSALGYFHDGSAPGSVAALARFDPVGSSPQLYVAGAFTLVDGLSARRIARWDGVNWLALGNGLDGPAETLLVFDDGSGPALYAAGSFLHAGVVSAHAIARWDGNGWSALGSGVVGFVAALASFDDGSGPALYAGGQFSIAGSAAASNLAKWNGVGWSALGSGLSGGTSASVSALASFDDGSGPALYVGGDFTSAGGVPVVGVARWNGLQWSAVGAGLEASSGFGAVYGFHAYDDGSGPALYAGGYFMKSGSQSVPGIARWNGAAWGPVGGGLASRLGESSASFAEFDDGTGRALFVGGNFGSCPDSRDSYLAKWGVPAGCASPGVSICEPGSGGVLACPCANPPAGAGLGCDNSSATGGASVAASGVARLSADSLRFTTSGELSSALSVLVQGTSASASGVVFGQGVRCVAGTLRRLFVKPASGGSIHVPGPNDPSISARSAALGDPIAQGQPRFYGVVYRDPNVPGGCAATSTFNVTQQLRIVWRP